MNASMRNGNIRVQEKMKYINSTIYDEYTSEHETTLTTPKTQTNWVPRFSLISVPIYQEELYLWKLLHGLFNLAVASNPSLFAFWEAFLESLYITNIYYPDAGSKWYMINIEHCIYFD